MIEIDSWMDKDLKAHASIVKYLGAIKHTHIQSCSYAWKMWNSLRSYCELQGDIEVLNASAQMSAIITIKSQDTIVYARPLQ